MGIFVGEGLFLSLVFALVFFSGYSQGLDHGGDQSGDQGGDQSGDGGGDPGGKLFNFRLHVLSSPRSTGSFQGSYVCYTRIKRRRNLYKTENL